MQAVTGKQKKQDRLYQQKIWGFGIKIREQSRNGRTKETTLVYKLVAHFYDAVEKKLHILFSMLKSVYVLECTINYVANLISGPFIT